MNTIEIRPLRRQELAAVVNLLADDALGQGRERADGDLHPDYVAAFEAIESDPAHEVLVAVANDEVLGCLQLSFLPGLSRRGMWRGQIEGVRVGTIKSRVNRAPNRLKEALNRFEVDTS